MSREAARDGLVDALRKLLGQLDSFDEPCSVCGRIEPEGACEDPSCLPKRHCHHGPAAGDDNLVVTERGRCGECDGELDGDRDERQMDDVWYCSFGCQQEAVERLTSEDEDWGGDAYEG